MFNLENAIQNWLKAFQKHRAFDEGSIREMELHLRDHVHDLVSEGKPEEEAFDIAVEEFGQIPEMAREEYKNIKVKTTLKTLITKAMITNHLRFALRIFRKDGIYSALNLLSITLGLCVGILTLLYFQNELNYDRHHKRASELYRVVQDVQAPGNTFKNARTARELAPLLKADLPEVAEYLRVNPWNRETVTAFKGTDKQQQFYEEGIVEADSNYFAVFTHEVIEGNLQTSLIGPDKVVITESTAQRYFDKRSVVGELLEFPNGTRTVSAVIKDLLDNSHLKFDILLSGISDRPWALRQDNAARKAEVFWNANIYTYVILHPEFDPNEWTNRFQIIYDKYYAAFGEVVSGTVSSYLEPLQDIHYHSVVERDETRGNLAYLYTIGAIGLFVVLMACINYVNMTTARAVIRTREMGIRKVLGFTRSRLFFMVLLEAFGMTFVALILALVLDFVVLEFSPLNHWLDKQLSIDFINNPYLLPGGLVVAMIVALISGLYPAAYVPRIPVTQAIKGNGQTRQSGQVLRKSLIIAQFVVSIMVISLTVIMNRQMQYIESVDMGLKPDNLIIIQLRDSARSSYPAMKNELLAHPEILDVTSSYGIPGMSLGNMVFKIERDSEMAQQNVAHIMAEDNYIDALGIELLKGRNFRPEDKKDRISKLLINETAARQFGWLDNPIDKRVRFYHGEEDMHVVGVIKDFNFQSLHTAVKPLFIFCFSRQGGYLYARTDANNTSKALDTLEETFRRYDPAHPFEYEFMDKAYEDQYRADQIQYKMVSSLSVISIVIALLGMVGLSAFMAGQKTKEISIRKTLGASLINIVVQFARSYVWLIGGAILLAVPAIHYLSQQWLANYAYQLSLSWYYYVFPGGAMMIMGILTVILQSLKAASINPAVGLRTE